MEKNKLRKPPRLEVGKRYEFESHFNVKFRGRIKEIDGNLIVFDDFKYKPADSKWEFFKDDDFVLYNETSPGNWKNVKEIL